MIHRLRILACSALLLAAVANAQEPETGAPVPAPQTSADPDIPLPEPAAGGQDENTAPSDYRASEKISEDLSVSFPVDI